MTNEAEQFGYADKKGRLQIPYGEYEFCFTDTFKTFAVVFHKDSGMIAIDKQRKILYNVYQYDNGPDYISEGLFRIVRNGKIGYADQNGDIIINPVYDDAYPFSEGKANVKLGEANFVIDKNGDRLKE